MWFVFISTEYMGKSLYYIQRVFDFKIFKIVGSDSDYSSSDQIQIIPLYFAPSDQIQIVPLYFAPSDQIQIIPLYFAPSDQIQIVPHYFASSDQIQIAQICTLLHRIRIRLFFCTLLQNSRIRFRLLSSVLRSKIFGSDSHCSSVLCYKTLKADTLSRKFTIVYCWVSFLLRLTTFTKQGFLYSFPCNTLS